MTTTEVKEPTTPATSLNDDSASNVSKNISNRKATRLEFVYDARDKESFYGDLETFHENRNTPFTKLPKINGTEVDLHKLYSEVVSRGGWLKVNIRNEWEELLPLLNLPQKCVNTSVALKYIYTRYLDKFEKANFLGEDPDRNDEPDDDSRHKKWSSKALHSVPLTYNYAQHIVPEPIRVLHKLSTEMYKGSEYDKLLLSLMSPLPNEQDFAINVCTLMANESKHTLKIEHCPKLIDALLAHAGVFCHFTMRDLFVQFYSRIRKHSLQSFWTDCLYNKPEILEITYDDYFQSPDEKLIDMGLSRPPLRLPNREYFEDGLLAGVEECRSRFENSNFLALGRGLGTHDYVGQRVNQVASIMRNLSFFEENIIILAKNRTFIRFLVMCSNIRWGNLHHVALDILGNIGIELELADPILDDLTRCLISTICDGLEGQDRGVIISSLEILYKLCQKEANEDHLHKCLDQNVYNHICVFLTLNDIMLLLYTLECAYALSTLGRKSCNSLIQVKGIVDTLVSLITVEAQSYGPDGCILMRVVETVPGNMLPIVAQNLANLQNVPMIHQQQLALQHQQQQLRQQQQLQQQLQTQNQHQKNQQQQHQKNIVYSDTNHKCAIDSEQQKQITTQQQVQPSKTTPIENNSSNAICTKPVTQTPPASIIKEQIELQQNSTIKKNPQPQLQENEQFALAWLQATFYHTNINSNRIEQQELYKMYVVSTQKCGRRGGGVVSPIHFPRLVRSVFGETVGPSLIKTTEPSGVELNAFYYVSIRMKSNPLPVHYKGVTLPAYQPNIHPTKVVQKMSAQAQLKHQPLHQQSIELIFKAKPEQSPQSIETQHIATQTQGNQITTNKLTGKNAVLNENIIALHHMPLIQNNSMANNIYNQVVTNAKNSKTTQSQQYNNVMQNSNSNVNPGIGTATGNGPTSSLIKSLLANKVTTATSITEANASGAPNNTSCLITQNVNLHQVTQRQHLQKQKELAQQQLFENQGSQVSSLTATTISALVNNPNIPTTPLKVGQTTIKAITTNTIIPATIIEKKTVLANETSENNNWDPVPPLAPLSGNISARTANNPIGMGGTNDDSNSTGNNSVASSILSTTQVNTTDDGESSYISFEGLLVSKSKSESSSMTEDENNSKDSFNKSTHVFNANQMLVDLLDRKSLEPPIGISIKRKLEEDFVSENENVHKKERTEININEDEMLTATPSKNAANLYAEMAASILEDEDLEEEHQIPLQHQQAQSFQQPVVQRPAEPPKQMITVPVPLQRQIIMSPNSSQVTLSRNTSTPQQIPNQATATIKTDTGLQTVPLILQKQVGPGGQQIIQPVIPQPQTQYMLATNQQGQTYLVAQQQPPTLNQALLVTQAGQQQGTPTKTIIILQQQGGPPQAVAQQQIIGSPGSSQKVIMTTQQGQQMIVTQLPRPVQRNQMVLNHPNATMVQATPSQNVVMTQTTPLIQQHSQLQIQTSSQSQLSKQIQLQTQPHLQIQPTVQQTTAQQQSILSQLPQIPATIKIHSHPPIQAQSAQTQTLVKMTSNRTANAIQQPSVSIVAQQHPQHAQQSQTKSQERKIFVTGNAEIPDETSVQPTPTPAKAASPTIASSSILSKHIKSITDIRSDDESIDPNWLWVCEWRGCSRKKFKSLRDVYRHACTVHCPENLDPGAEIYCQWGPGSGLCDNIPRKRFSLMTHLSDRHCTFESFKAAVQRRVVTGVQVNTHSQPVTIIKNIQSSSTNSDAAGTASPTHSTSSTGSVPAAASAAMHAIKRHSSDFLNTNELMDENEGPVTKSIRLTAALILKNLVTYTSMAKRNVRQYEPHLAGVALSNVESSRTVAQILYEINN